MHAEQALIRGDEVQVLSAKKQILKKLDHANSITTDLKPRGVILYDLEFDSPLDNENAGNVAKIREYDEEYTVEMVKLASDFSRPYYFMMRRLPRNRERRVDGDFSSNFLDGKRSFVIRRKSSNTVYGSVNDVLVKIKRVDVNSAIEAKIETKEGGSFSFGYEPPFFGKYEINVTVNDRYIKGSPFKWLVE